MDEITLELYKSLGLTAGQIILVMVIAYMLKKYFENQLNKISEVEKNNLQVKFEGYKNQLEQENKLRQLEIDKSFEDYRNKLEVLKLENQIMFNKLHETRFGIIAELYKKITTLNRLLFDYIIPFKSSSSKESLEKEQEERRISTTNAYLDFTKFYFDNKIYFEPKTCDMIETFQKEIVGIINDYGELEYQKALGMEGTDLSDSRRKKILSWEKLKNDIPKVLITLENDFRSKLGVPFEKEHQ